MKSKTEVQKLAASALALMDEHSAGWSRLREILKDAMKDERILSSSGATDFLETVYELSDYGMAGNAIPAFRPLYPTLAGDHLRNPSGRIKGGQAMKQRKEVHTRLLKDAVIDLLKNPEKSGMTDPEIARWLMERERSHRFNPKSLTEKTMTTRVKEIRAAYKASN